MGICPKGSQTLFSKLHNMSNSRSYITVCSHSRTWWVNHAWPQHNRRNTFMSNAALDHHCSRTAWPSRDGCCRPGHKIPFKHTLLLKRVIFCQYLLVNIFCAYYCHLYIELCICLTKIVSRYRTWVMPKSDIFPGKSTEGIFVMFWNICLL